MQNRPNLDYEPGPVGASYSRVGPPSEAREKPVRKSMYRFRHELSTELGVAGENRKRPGLNRKH